MLIAMYCFITKVVLPQLGNLAVSFAEIIGTGIILLVGISILFSAIGIKFSNVGSSIVNALFRAIGYVFQSIFRGIMWIFRNILLLIPILFSNTRNTFVNRGMSPLASNVLSSLVVIVVILVII